ncbi:hypothetical protein Chor_010514 [Crotalus horridus]
MTPHPLQERADMPLRCLLLLLAWLGPPSVAAQTPACKMRITQKGLELVKQEGLRFVEQELETISIPDLHGKEGQFHYNISDVKVTHLQLNFSELQFQPEQYLAFRINNGSIGVHFRRQLLYWFFYDVGSIWTGAEGVNIHTQLQLSQDQGGRLKITNMSCNASIARMNAGFSGTLRKVYEFLAVLVTKGVRYLLSQQGMFFPLREENETLPNLAPEPLLKETERMVYMGLSEYFFDSALFSYYRAGVLNMEFAGNQVPKDLEVLLRASFFGSIMLLDPSVADAPLALKLQVTEAPRCTIRTSGTSVSVTALLNIFLAPPEQPLILLSSLTMESRLSAKVVLHNKALRVQLDLRRFRIYSTQSAFESLAVKKTKRGVRIPLPEGMDFTKETIRSHLGYLTIGADLKFTKGLREVIKKLRETTRPSLAPRAA